MKLTTLPLPRQKSIKQGFVNHFLISFTFPCFLHPFTLSLLLVSLLSPLLSSFVLCNMLRFFLISVTFSSPSEWHCIMTHYSFMDLFFHRQKCHQYIKISEMKFSTIERGSFLVLFLSRLFVTSLVQVSVLVFVSSSGSSTVIF